MSMRELLCRIGMHIRAVTLRQEGDRLVKKCLSCLEVFEVPAIQRGE